MRYIDSHFHIWDLDYLNLSWLDDYKSLNRTYLFKDYLREWIGLDLKGCMYVEVDCDKNCRQKESSYITNLNEPLLKAAILSTDLSANMQIPKNLYLKGIREVLHTKNVRKNRIFEKSFKDGLEVLKSHNLIFEACINQEELGDFYQVIKDVDTKIMIDHFGNPMVNQDFLSSIEFKKYKKDMIDIATCDSTYCKLSGFDIKKMSLKNSRYLLEFIVDIFGEDRVVYGSNYPVCKLQANVKEWIDFLSKSFENEQFLDKLFYQNAKKIYDIKG